MVKEMQ
jgi:hypothetical protein